METNKEIPTAEEYFLQKFGNKLSANDSWVIRFAEEYAKHNRDYHLSKQAELIAEKWFKERTLQSILQASEEYINNLK